MLGEGLKFSSILGQLMIAVLFAYEGWTNVGAIAGEMKDPGRDLPKAIVGRRSADYGGLYYHQPGLPVGTAC